MIIMQEKNVAKMVISKKEKIELMKPWVMEKKRNEYRGKMAMGSESEGATLPRPSGHYYEYVEKGKFLF